MNARMDRRGASPPLHSAYFVTGVQDLCMVLPLNHSFFIPCPQTPTFHSSTSSSLRVLDAAGVSMVRNAYMCVCVCVCICVFLYVYTYAVIYAYIYA
jgi:hypothetical protein